MKDCCKKVLKQMALTKLSKNKDLIVNFQGQAIISKNPLNPSEIFNFWHDLIGLQNCGAFVSFVGLVRDEDEISALSFDIYEPILWRWFQAWQERAAKLNAMVFFAHAKGNVEILKCSYISAVLSPRRRVALGLIDEFVEDFKSNAPIWKYDLKNGRRIFATNRSQALPGAGILAN